MNIRISKFLCLLLILVGCTEEVNIIDSSRTQKTSDSTENVDVPTNINGIYLATTVLQKPADDSPKATVGVAALDNSGQKINFGDRPPVWNYDLPASSAVSVSQLQPNSTSYDVLFSLEGENKEEVLFALRNIKFEINYIGESKSVGVGVEELALLAHGILGLQSCNDQLKPFKEIQGNNTDLTLTIENRNNIQTITPSLYNVYRVRGDLERELVSTLANSETLDFTVIGQNSYAGELFEARDSNGECEALYGVPNNTAAQPFVLPASNRGGFHDCSKEGKLWALNGNIPSALESITTSIPNSRIFWLNYEGEREEYPDGFVSSFVGHPWVITDANGVCQAIYVTEPNIPSVVYTP